MMLCSSILLIAAATLTTAPVDLPARNHSPASNDCLVSFTGHVIEAVRDNPDTRYYRLFLSDGRSVMSAVVATNLLPAGIENLANETVRVEGTISRQQIGWRKFSWTAIDRVNGIEIIENVHADPFAVAALSDLSDFDPESIRQLGQRQVAGIVRATWKPRAALLWTEAYGGVIVGLAHNQPMPAIGDAIQVSGIVSTDTAHLQLSYAVWRQAGRGASEIAEALPLTGDKLDSDTVCSTFDGRHVLVRGTVRDTTKDASLQDFMLLECGQHILKVDPGLLENAFDGIHAGCEVEVSGIFMAELDPQSIATPFSRVKDFTIVLRSADGIRVVKPAPWWTLKLFMVLTAILVVSLLAVFVWTIVLKRLAGRQARALAAEQEARIVSDIRVYERTHLAVELHDSIAQNLTAASMEIEAVRKHCTGMPRNMMARLDIAGKTLKSSRDELRNCIWDLRNDALSETDMSVAIRRTLQPLNLQADIAIRFNVPRDMFSDTTAHAVLRIVRELVLNASRHGKAGEIRVAGCVDGGEVLFSVTDNGCGFDPNKCPGIQQGHFGLQGINERIRQFGGTLDISSTPGCGAKATIHIKLRENETQDTDRR